MEEYIQPGIDIEDIEMLAFSFDGVLYSAPSFEEEYFEYLVQVVSKLSVHDWDEATARQKLIEMNIIYCDAYDRHCIRQHSGRELGFFQSTFDEYCMKHYFFPKKSPIRAFSNDVLRTLEERYDIYLFTNDSMPVLKSKARRLGIDISIFTNSYSPRLCNPDSFDYFTKYRELMNAHVLDGLEIYAIGTNYHEHIHPMIYNHGSGLHVDPSNVEETEQFLIKRFLNR